jgi:diacylglycerol kinase (ATP)
MSGRTPVQSILSGRSVVVYVNSEAGRGKARACLPQVQKLFDAFHIAAEFVTTTSAAELESLVPSALSRSPSAIFSMGGDGTFQALANAACGSGVLLGVLPTGGGNDFAAALGLPVGRPLQAAEIALSGAPRSVDLVRVRTSENRIRSYVGGGGIGLDAEAVQYFSGAYRNLPGRSRYIASALRALIGFVPLEVHLDFPESDLPPYKGKVLLAAVLNTPTYGAGLKLAPGGVLDDGMLEIVLVEPIGPLGILRLLPRLIRTGELKTPHLKRWQARKVRFTTSRSCPFHGDGEILGATPVEIEVVPKAIEVLAPSHGFEQL